MTSIRWGIIGPGGIAHQFAKALAASKQGSLQGVASRSQQRAVEFAQLYQAPDTYADYDAIINAQNVDAIYIATPHSHHYPYAKACIEAGKHVLMEKPLTVNAQQTRHLINLAVRHNCVFQEALWSRYMPCFETVRDWLDKGLIGDVQYISSQIGFPFSHLQNHRLTSPGLAGGALLDLGVYSVSISQFLLREYPNAIAAISQINSDRVDQNTLVNLAYPSGVSSQFTCTIGAQATNTMTIHGKAGYILLPAHFWNGQHAQRYQDDELVESVDFHHQVNGFEYQIESIMQSICSARLCDPRMSHADSINVMETLDEVRKQVGLTFPERIERVE
ncbi:Gfo/Idh/MocA family oxidoreductase [Aliiglaciecola sp. LCG003]|uniref:Gfo/Idh/MocA family protein n=1 Tax=Aliiglaciecola sp. LCG003 TaxID=3053655 RepID=UPI0025743781|nr:Gfo/Idh/MocA family oxidoreductase [Aliiglaciecola sp. LCG003]WJG08425.1 Gfo/Idh/MocA family oxidoreductase [Aliiglaciecola sp. LCG003]